MDPHRSFSNSIVKGYSGEDTKRGAFWENNTMSKFSLFLSFYTYSVSLDMESYAIVQASGKQFWVEENKFYDFDKLPLDKGDTFNLNQILLVNQNDNVSIGKPFLDSKYTVQAKVLRHL